jgi:hypothetical protein
MAEISQRSFEVRLGKFKNGNAIIQGWVDYTPANILISKAGISAFIEDVISKNNDIVSTKLPLTTLQDERKSLTFKLKGGGNINCLEGRIRNVLQYIMGDLPSHKTAITKLKEITRKFNPDYKKKTNLKNQKAKGISPSEKSFNSLIGFGSEVIGIIQGMGADYVPSNVNIQLAEFSSFVYSLKTLNQNISQAKEAYGEAVYNRKEIYNGTNGMYDRIRMIKAYLASFEGEKKSSHYIDFIQAIK